MGEMKCPFCGQELNYLAEDIYYCPNHQKYMASEELWQELIRAKKQVDIAYSGLLGIPEADNSYIKDVTAEDTVEEMRKVR